MGRVKTFLRFNTSITTLVVTCIFTLVSSSLGCSKEANKDKNYKILAFGDSLTAGHRLPAKDSYPAQLEQMMIKDGYKVQITNAGVSGDTSEQGLRRVDWALQQAKYDVVLLCLGANDGLRQLSIKNMEDNLSKIVEKFQASGVKVLFIGMQLPSNLYSGYRGEFEATFKKIADKKKLPYLPFFLEGVAANPNYNLEDQVHPNAKGYEIVAKNVMPFLKANLP